MRKTIAFIAGALCIAAAPLQSRAADTASPTPSPASTPAVGKKHLDANAWLDKHAKLKDEVLAKFDTNKNGKLDPDEIPAFLKWIKDRQEKRKGSKDDGGKTTKDTPPAITSPIVTQ